MSKLIYIFSTGHSGSTLLDILLGSFPNVFSTGESKYLTWQLFRTKDGSGSVKIQNICTCNKRFQECAVWSKVIERIEKEKNIEIFKNPAPFSTSPLLPFARSQKTKLSHRIYSKFITFEMLYTKSNIFSRLLRKTYIKEVENVWKVIDTLGKVTNSEYVVDSSKTILRYYLLKIYRPDDVFLIINSRDNYGYANSFIKQQLRPEISLRSKKKYEERVQKLIKNRKQEYISTIYEEVVANPGKELNKVAQILNLNYNPQQLYNIDTTKYHMVAGNPMRYKGKIEIKHDDTWKNQINKKTKNEIAYFIKKYKL